MKIKLPKLKKINTLRSFITIVVTMIVAFSLFITGTYFYLRSSRILTSQYKANIVQQLSQTNQYVENQIAIIDSFYLLLLSNTTIQENLEPFIPSREISNNEAPFQMEKQITQLLISTNLWNEKFINSISIIDSKKHFYCVSLYDHITKKETIDHLLASLPEDSNSLEIKTLKQNGNSLFFTRNIFSVYTGKKIGSIIIDINTGEWEKSYSKNLEQNWKINLFNEESELLNNREAHQDSSLLFEYIAKNKKEIVFEEVSLGRAIFFIASKQLESIGITSVVTVPKNYILAELNTTLKNFLTIFFFILAITVLTAMLLSHTITLPIEKMITYVRETSQGKTKPQMPKYLYSEFNEFAAAFHSMLKQLDISYNEIFQKQLLLKNAKIESLQSQMDPHFLFNVLDTIAWKAQINGNEEIYQMILSLGELLRGNILAKEKDFVPLEEELQYVKFYTYLQQMRFEDKFSIQIQCNPESGHIPVPRFCIQPLVENAIVHGLEPKKGNGKLRVNIFEQSKSLQIVVIDNGVGFPENYRIDQEISPSSGSHTHIGLKNLDKRLSLLYNETCRLQIQSIPDRYTMVSFQIPLQTEVDGCSSIY